MQFLISINPAKVIFKEKMWEHVMTERRRTKDKVYLSIRPKAHVPGPIISMGKADPGVGICLKLWSCISGIPGWLEANSIFA